MDCERVYMKLMQFRIILRLCAYTYYFNSMLKPQTEINFSRSGKHFITKAKILLQEGNYDQAIAYFSKAIKISIRFIAAAYSDRGIAYKNLKMNNFTELNIADLDKNGHRDKSEVPCSYKIWIVPDKNKGQ